MPRPPRNDVHYEVNDNGYVLEHSAPYPVTKGLQSTHLFKTKGEALVVALGRGYDKACELKTLLPSYERVLMWETCDACPRCGSRSMLEFSTSKREDYQKDGYIHGLIKCGCGVEFGKLIGRPFIEIEIEKMLELFEDWNKRGHYAPSRH